MKTKTCHFFFTIIFPCTNVFSFGLHRLVMVHNLKRHIFSLLVSVSTDGLVGKYKFSFNVYDLQRRQGPEADPLPL